MAKSKTVWQKIAENKILRFFVVGVTATIIDYAISTALVMTIFGGNPDSSVIATGISGVICTFVAFFLHSKITWMERDPGKLGIVKFFIWNVILVVSIRPILNWLFGLLTGLYQFGLAVCEFIHLPFSYEFIETSGRFVLMTLVTMVINFFVYERFVFGSPKSKSLAKDKDVKHSEDH